MQPLADTELVLAKNSMGLTSPIASLLVFCNNPADESPVFAVPIWIVPVPSPLPASTLTVPPFRTIVPAKALLLAVPLTVQPASAVTVPEPVESLSPTMD